MASVSVQIRARSDALPRTRSLTRAVIRAGLMIMMPMPVGTGQTQRVDRAGLVGNFQVKRSISSWPDLAFGLLTAASSAPDSRGQRPPATRWPP